MHLEEINAAYEMFTKDLGQWAPDGIIEVDLVLLQQAGLLKHTGFEEAEQREELPHYFHVVETEDRVTLFNHQFAVWVVPKVVEGKPLTIGMIAWIEKRPPRLEIVFSTTGVYNTPKFVMRLLKHYLAEVIETQQEIASIGQNEQT